jgi:hypothetical protein
MEAIYCPETTVKFQGCKRRHIPEDVTPCSRRCESMVSANHSKDGAIRGPHSERENSVIFSPQANYADRERPKTVEVNGDFCGIDVVA